MSRENVSVILDAGLALDDRKGQVADLAQHRAHSAEHDRRPQRQTELQRAVHDERRDQNEHRAADHTADRALDRLFRTDDRRRTKAGSFAVENCISFDHFQEWLDEQPLEDSLQSSK